MINNQNLAVLSEKVAYLEAALKTAGVLPEVSALDNGATLQVIEGAWATGDLIPGVVNTLDSTSTTNALSAAQGKALNDKITGLVNEVNLAITTDVTGNYTSEISFDYALICAVKKRDTTNDEIAFASLGSNYFNNAYVIHFANSDGTAFANKTCNITLWYI